jgi:hypothetical protein
MSNTLRILSLADLEHGSANETMEEVGLDVECELDDLLSEFYVKKIPQKSKIFIPDGWVIFSLCNRPGQVYLGPEVWFNHYRINGDAPCLVSWDLAKLVTSDKYDGDFGPWNLRILGEAPEWVLREVAEDKARWGE